jgi:hypothetical protein
MEGRNVIFGSASIRSLILKEGISDEILEVLVILTFKKIILILFVFIFHKGR